MIARVAKYKSGMTNERNKKSHRKNDREREREGEEYKEEERKLPRGNKSSRGRAGLDNARPTYTLYLYIYIRRGEAMATRDNSPFDADECININPSSVSFASPLKCVIEKLKDLYAARVSRCSDRLKR